MIRQFFCFLLLSSYVCKFQTIAQTVLFHLPVHRLLTPWHTSNLYDTIVKLTKSCSRMKPANASATMVSNMVMEEDGKDNILDLPQIHVISAWHEECKPLHSVSLSEGFRVMF